ncbi:MAG TPA: cytochrome C, partial [bacterium]
MKVLKVSVILIAAILITIGLSGTAKAFHSGGVAECEGCHTMHNSFEGAQMTINALPVGTTNAYLLKGQDQSS